RSASSRSACSAAGIASLRLDTSAAAALAAAPSPLAFRWPVSFGRVFPLGFQLPDLLGQAVALGLQLLRGLDEAAALLIERQNLHGHWRQATALEAHIEGLRIVADRFQIVHGGSESLVGAAQVIGRPTRQSPLGAARAQRSVSPSSIPHRAPARARRAFSRPIWPTRWRFRRAR